MYGCNHLIENLPPEINFGEESKYILRSFGTLLAESLAEIIARIPSDPIEFLSSYLKNYVHIREKFKHEEEELQELLAYEQEQKEAEDKKSILLEESRQIEFSKINTITEEFAPDHDLVELNDMVENRQLTPINSEIHANFEDTETESKTNDNTMEENNDNNQEIKKTENEEKAEEKVTSQSISENEGNAEDEATNLTVSENEGKPEDGVTNQPVSENEE